MEIGVDMCCQWDDFSTELTENQSICSLYKGATFDQTKWQDTRTSWAKNFQFQELDDKYNDEEVNGGTAGDSTFLEEFFDEIFGEDGAVHIKAGSTVAILTLYLSLE